MKQLNGQEKQPIRAEKSLIIPDPKNIPQIVKDRPDNYILACALSAQASFIVSGDKYLLSLKKFQGIPIITPKEFLRRFQK